MASICLSLPEKVSANRTYGGMHFRARMRIVENYRWSTLSAFKALAPITTPVHMTYDFTFKGALLDVSNCSLMQKLLEDCFVSHGILKGDDPKYVTGITMTVRKGKEDTCIVSWES